MFHAPSKGMGQLENETTNLSGKQSVAARTVKRWCFVYRFKNARATIVMQSSLRVILTNRQAAFSAPRVTQYVSSDVKQTHQARLKINQRFSKCFSG
jgi:hypothetical protein